MRIRNPVRLNVSDKMYVQFDVKKTARILSGNQRNIGGVKSAKIEPSSLLSAAEKKSEIM